MSWSEAKQRGVEDARLMERIRSRDASAFEALYDAYHRLVYGVAFRMLGDTSSAEDVTQGVFLKIWSAPQLYASGNLSGWIVRITRNRALDVLRSRARTIAEMPDDQPDAEMLEPLAFAHLDGAAVRAALSHLPKDQRIPIEMGFFGGVTHAEIAQRTGVPLGTVKTRIRAGLRRLRETLEGTVTV